MFPGAEFHAFGKSEKEKCSAKEGGGNKDFHMTDIRNSREIYFNLLLNKDLLGAPGKWAQLEQPSWV